MIVARALTVRELVAALRSLPEDAQVVASYDCDCAQGEIVGVRAGTAELEPYVLVDAVILVVG